MGLGWAIPPSAGSGPATQPALSTAAATWLLTGGERVAAHQALCAMATLALAYHVTSLGLGLLICGNGPIMSRPLRAGIVTGGGNVTAPCKLSSAVYTQELFSPLDGMISRN